MRQIVVMNPSGSKKCKNLPSGGMIRMLGVQQRNDVKATQNLAIIVFFFMVCWIPLYTINCYIAFDKHVHVNSTFMFSCIILSHLNSACNPLLYAYHLRDFRAALKNFFCSLLGMPLIVVDPYPTRSTRTQMFKTQQRSSATSDFSKIKLTCPKVGVAIVTTSATVATAPAGKLDPSIWRNITEDSGRDSGSSQDSLRDIDSSRHDTLLMLRPATPYRSNVLKEVASETPTPQYDSSDYVPYFKRNVQKEESALSETLKGHSKSSPQLSGKASGDYQKKASNYLRPAQSPKNKLSPYKIVSSLFKSKRKLNRSLSDSDSTKKLDGIVADYYSVPM